MDRKDRLAQFLMDDDVETLGHLPRGGMWENTVTALASRHGVSLPEAMQQSQHKSVQQAASYYNDTDRARGKVARLVT